MLNGCFRISTTFITYNKPKGKGVLPYDIFIFLFRWYEELQCKEVDEEIKRRLQAGEEVTLSNGKLLDRLLAIKMIREDIPKRASYWTRREKRNPDPTKATFIYDLIPIAESRLENIKYVTLSLFEFFFFTNLAVLPSNTFRNGNKNILVANSTLNWNIVLS